MKGVIFNLLENFVTEGWGDAVYEEILQSCPLHTQEPFIGPCTYPDADLMTIVTKTTERLGISVPEAVHAFGKYCFPKLAEKFPVFVANHTHPKTFLKTIDAVIHVEVRKLLQDADPPSIRFEEPDSEHLVLHYTSKRKLCAFMTGLLEGTAEYFKTPITYHHTQCMLTGADHCTLQLTFATAARS